MKLIHFLGFSAFTFASVVTVFPAYGTLAGLSIEERDLIISRLQVRQADRPPDTSAKLVNDKDHPWEPLQPGDIRGPCPGLNTLASHGWLSRNGIATPAQIIDAAQQGFNMGNDLAVFLTYAAMLVDGNMITNLLSIGGKSPPKPAIVGGLDTNAVFEGDASMTRVSTRRSLRSSPISAISLEVVTTTLCRKNQKKIMGLISFLDFSNIRLQGNSDFRGIPNFPSSHPVILPQTRKAYFHSSSS